MADSVSRRCAILGVALFALLAVAHAQAQVLRGDTGLEHDVFAEKDDGANALAVGISGTTEKRDVLGMTLAALVIFVAAGGGTGGGGVLDPIYILIMELDAKIAIPLSSITIVGGAIANLLLNARRTRPNSVEPLIDWDVILVMQPLLLLGASCGTVLNTIMPTWLLCVLLVLILSATGSRTLQKAISARQKERWHCEVSPEETSLLGEQPRSDGAPKTQEFKAAVPWQKLGALFGLFVGVLGMNTLQGGEHFASPVGVDSSSALFPVLVALPFVFLFVVCYFSLQNIVATHRKQQHPDYDLSPHEIQWTLHSICYFPALSLMAGAVSGMFGIGGGIINGPLLLEIGVDPAAASAMTATTVLFSSGMSSSNYVLLGSLDFHLAQFLLPLGFLATYAGHVCLMRVVRRFNCPSLIIFSMAIIVLISAVAMSVESIRTLLDA